jgi:large subunit ribosomal protein L4
MSAHKKNAEQASGLCYPVNSAHLNLQTERSAVSPVAFATWVRALLQNWRQGTVACKGRSDVNRTNKKPWKQKGTGRARAGTARSPLWRGGGVIFGPMARVRRLKENRKIRRSVMQALLFDRVENNALLCLEWMVDGIRPSAMQAHKVLKTAGLVDTKVLLFVAPDDMLTYASFANLSNVSIVFFDQLNAFDAAVGRTWVFLKKDEQAFKDMVSLWN